MPSKKRISKKPRLQLKETDQDPKQLEDFIREASEVRALTQTGGWGVLARDLENFQAGIARKLAYLSPKREEYYEARILFIAVDKIFSLVNDYEHNRNEAITLLNKLENPDMAITMDYDTE